MRTLFTSAVVAVTLVKAQEITGDIRGIVTDPSGAVISGAVVQVTNIDRNVMRELKAGRDGSYAATYLPVGNYSILAMAPGFAQFETSGIVLDVADR